MNVSLRGAILFPIKNLWAAHFTDITPSFCEIVYLISPIQLHRCSPCICMCCLSPSQLASSSSLHFVLLHRSAFKLLVSKTNSCIDDTTSTLFNTTPFGIWICSCVKSTSPVIPQAIKRSTVC